MYAWFNVVIVKLLVSRLYIDQKKERIFSFFVKNQSLTTPLETNKQTKRKGYVLFPAKFHECSCSFPYSFFGYQTEMKTHCLTIVLACEQVPKWSRAKNEAASKAWPRSARFARVVSLTGFFFHLVPLGGLFAGYHCL